MFLMQFTEMFSAQGVYIIVYLTSPLLIDDLSSFLGGFLSMFVLLCNTGLNIFVHLFL